MTADDQRTNTAALREALSKCAPEAPTYDLDATVVVVNALPALLDELDALRADLDTTRATLRRVTELVDAWSEPKDATSVIVNTHFDLGQTHGIDIGIDAVLADLRAALDGSE